MKMPVAFRWIVLEVAYLPGRWQLYTLRGHEGIPVPELLFANNDELLLRKSGPELTRWRDKTPRPHEAPGVHCLRGGVLPWYRTRDDGTDRGTP